MTTKHKADEHADNFDWEKSTYSIHEWCIKSQEMLRTIPALEAEIARLRSEASIKGSQLTNCHKRIDELVHRYESE